MRFLLLLTVLTFAGCASVQLDPQKTAATTLAPFNAQLGFNRVSVPDGSRLAAASIDGKPAFCTLQNAWFAIGEARAVCFTDDAGSGYLDHYYVLGTLRSLTYESHIPYALDPGAVSVARLVPMVSDADVAECAYQAQVATVTERGFLAPALDAANLRTLCLRAKAARRTEGLH